jgi:molecular chaperone DnaK
MRRTIGIDLGTTNSAVATVDDGEVKILNNTEGWATTPSVVFFPDDEDDDAHLVGLMAKNSAAMAPANVVQFIKCRMGKREIIKSPSGTEYTPETISALILKKLKQDAEAALGESGIVDVVITVPAYFGDDRRKATIDAGKIAGLNVLRLINEPTAAAVAFGMDKGKMGKVLVYDLGGGTFDVTLMEIKDDNFDVIGTNGDPNLGGKNFDNKLTEMIIADLKAQGCLVDETDDLIFADVREKAEHAKKALSQKEQTTTKHTIGGKNYTVKLTRAEFEEAAKQLLERTKLYLSDMMSEANVTWAEVDHLLVIGGSTRMPMVKEMLEELSGKTIKYEVNPDTAVAIGAALLANATLPEGKENTAPSGAESGIANFRISDVTSQSLGVITVDDRDINKKINSVIIPHNTKIPAKKSGMFATVYDNQTRLLVEVTEGNDTDVEYVKIIGSSTLELPPYPKNSPIEVIYQYDIDQTIFIEVFDKVANTSLGTFEIDRVANLSDEQLATAISAVNNITVE